MTNEYLPASLRDAVFLYPAGDVSDKTWDEDALRAWEVAENDGRAWAGRQLRGDQGVADEKHSAAGEEGSE